VSLGNGKVPLADEVLLIFSADAGVAATSQQPQKQDQARAQPQFLGRKQLLEMHANLDKHELAPAVRRYRSAAGIVRRLNSDIALAHRLDA